MNFLRRLMIGRYGNDDLNRFLLIVSLIFLVVTSIGNLTTLAILPILLLGYVYFRMFSRNIHARRAENQKFMIWWRPYAQKIASMQAQRTDRTHKYFRCKVCKRTLRVPRGRGKIEITCPHCRAKMVKKT